MINAILIVSFLVFAAIAVIVSRNETLDQYLSNFRATNGVSIAASLLASLVGGWMFFGLTQIGYEAGVAGIYIGLGYAVGLVLFYIFAQRIINIVHINHAHTLDDVIYKYFDRKVAAIFLIVNFIFFIAVLSAQYIALRQLLYSVGFVNSSIIFWTFSVTVIMYTAYGGFKGVLVTDKYQLITIFITLGAGVYCVLSVSEELTQLPRTYYVGTNYGMAFIFAAILFFPLTLFTRSDLWQRVASARSVKDLRFAIVITVPVLVIIYGVLTLLGMSARSKSASIDFVNSGSHTLEFLILSLNNIVGSEISILIVVIGISAALLSTIDTNTNVLTAIVGRWIRGNYQNSSISDYRIISFAIGVFALLLSIYIKDIVNVIVSAGAIILILLPPVFHMILKPNAKANSAECILAMSSIILGYAAFAIVFLLANPKAAFIPGFIVSSIVWYIGMIIIRNLGAK